MRSENIIITTYFSRPQSVNSMDLGVGAPSIPHPFKATEKTIININFITLRSFSSGQSDFLLETGQSLHMRPLRQPSFVLKEQSRYLQ